MEDHLYLVCYDIRDPKRWRKVFRTMRGYGDWLQLSVFQCLLGKQHRVEMIASLKEIIDHHEDHIIVIDIGPENNVAPRITSLGKTFDPPTREPIIV